MKVDVRLCSTVPPTSDYSEYHASEHHFNVVPDQPVTPPSVSSTTDTPNATNVALLYQLLLEERWNLKLSNRYFEFELLRYAQFERELAALPVPYLCTPLAALGVIPTRSRLQGASTETETGGTELACCGCALRLTRSFATPACAEVASSQATGEAGNARVVAGAAASAALAAAPSTSVHGMEGHLKQNMDAQLEEQMLSLLETLIVGKEVDERSARFCRLPALSHDVTLANCVAPIQCFRNATHSARCSWKHATSLAFPKFTNGEPFQNYVELPAQCRSEETSLAEAAGPSGRNAESPMPRVYQTSETWVKLEYLVPELPSKQSRYADRVEPLRAKLLYFFIQAPAPEAPAGIILRIAPTLQESQSRVREVTYDRGAIVDELAREALRMSAASERLRSYETSSCPIKYEADEALTLAGLGFFVPAASAQTDYRIVKCAFCRRSFTFGTRIAEFRSYSLADSRIAKLLWRHSVLCSTCPTSIGLNGDNRPLEPLEIKNYLFKHQVDPFCSSQMMYSESLQTRYKLLVSAQNELLYRLPRQPAYQMSSTAGSIQLGLQLEGEALTTTSESLSHRSAFGEAGRRGDIPEVDDERYYHYRAEFEVEPFAEFNALEYNWSEYTNLDGFEPRLEVIDYMIGMEPARPDMWHLVAREQTFIELNWSTRVTLTNPTCESIAVAGFYYAGEADCVRCFWCSLGLNQWEPGDDPWREHARFSPRCPWLLRCRGRYYVRKTIMQAVSTPAVDKEKTHIITCWEEAHGGAYATTSLMEFRLENREFKARVELPAYLALIDELHLNETLVNYANESYLRETGDDPLSAQTMLELVWEYSAQMETQQLMNAFDYVARCRHWKQFQTERQQAITSQSSFSNGQSSEAHLSVPATSGSSQQCPQTNEIVSLFTNELSGPSSGRQTSAGTFTSATTRANPSPAQRLPETDTTRDRPYAQESYTPTGVAIGQSFQAPSRTQNAQSSVAHTYSSESTNSSGFSQLPQQLQPSVPQRPEVSARNGNSSVESISDSTPSELICRVCYDRPFNVVLVPCGHFAVCSSCAERCKDCPICRRPIRGTVFIKSSN